MTSPHRKSYDEQKAKLARLSKARLLIAPAPGANRKHRRAQAKRRRATQAARRAWDRLVGRAQ